MDGTDSGAESARLGARNAYQTRAGRIAGMLLVAVWLLYLIGPVVDLLTQHYSVPNQVTGLSIIVVFCTVYLVYVPRWPMQPRHALPGVLALAALAVAACLLFGGTGATTLWIFISSATGLLVVNRRHAAVGVLVCTACYLLFCETGHVGSEAMLSNLLPVVFIGMAMIGLRRQLELTAELARAREEVAQLAASEERQRLARDMHDLTGQSLSMVTLKSELAARLLGRLPASADRDRARDEIEQVAAVSRQTLHDIREAISGYRRPTLAVEVITARAVLVSAGIAVEDDPALILASGTFDPDAEAALAWCLREAVTNVVRHSGARHCRISLTSQPDTVALIVSDDGHGYAAPIGPGARLAGLIADAGTGLRGMSERLRAAGGSLELRPDGRPGFCLTATVPARLEQVTSSGT
jgi:two-component system sensor histidine kinase DesK